MAASKQAHTLTHFRNAVPLVWGSLRLTPTSPRVIVGTVESGYQAHIRYLAHTAY